MDTIQTKIPLSIGQEFRINSPQIDRLAMKEIYTVERIDAGCDGEPIFITTAMNLKREPLGLTAFFPERGLLFYAARGEMMIKKMEVTA